MIDTSLFGQPAPDAGAAEPAASAGWQGLELAKATARATRAETEAARVRTESEAAIAQLQTNMRLQEQRHEALMVEARQALSFSPFSPEGGYRMAFERTLGTGSPYGYDDLKDIQAHVEDAAKAAKAEALAARNWHNTVLWPAWEKARDEPAPDGFLRDWQAWARSVPAFVFPADPTKPAP